MTKNTRTARRARPGIKSSPPAVAATPAAAPVPATRRLFPLTPWRWGAAGILAGAAALRLVELSMKVLHHDEGVNGMFMTTLFRNGYYHYDPSNFHGPTLYYFAWITTTINSFFFGKEGLSTDALRIVTVLFGLGVIWLLLSLRDQLGDFGSLAAAALAAVSPGFVFFSRYFIHEVLFVFFSLGAVIAWLRFKETGKSHYLMLASASVAMLGGTKETWIITLAVWLIAIPCTAIYSRLRGIPAITAASSPSGQVSSTHKKDKLNLYGTAALVFLTVWVLFYSSFFTNFPRGIYDSVLTFTYWFQTSSSAHRYGFFKYVEWLWKEESSILVLGTVGLVLTFLRARTRFMVFVAFWALGIFCAYSLVPYKTPWLVLNILLPFIMVAGYGFEQLYRRSRVAAWIPLLIAVAICAYQAIEVSFFRYDDDSVPYVYAHSNRELLLLVDKVNSIAAQSPEGKDIGITIMSPEHWPLPWYLRDYPKAGYWGKVVDSKEPILIVHADQVNEVEQKFGANYRLIRSYTLRPGNRLFLYIRKSQAPQG